MPYFNVEELTTIPTNDTHRGSDAADTEIGQGHVDDELITMDTETAIHDVSDDDHDVANYINDQCYAGKYNIRNGHIRVCLHQWWFFCYVTEVI